MKKSILFVCCDMGKGGVSKSLVNLLNCLDYGRYDVDLFLFEKKGLFLEQIPNQVNMLPSNESAKELLKRGCIIETLIALCTIRINKLEKNLEKKWSRYWKNCKTIFQVNAKVYDIAIAYNDGVELYYVMDCIEAKTKIGYNHIDYSNRLTYKPNLDRPYYEKLDFIVTVSDICAERLRQVFPEFSSKIRVVENIVNKDTLVTMAGKSDPYERLIEDRTNTLVLVSVAGLYKRKGFDLTAGALKILKEKGYCFKWYILGRGPEECEIKRIIQDADISNETVFLYEQSNPYPYIRWADIFILTSYAEGKSIAVEEAKLLERPILITNYSSAADQITHLCNGLVAEMTVESVAENLELLINDTNMRGNFSRELKKNGKSNVDESLEKIYSLWK